MMILPLSNLSMTSTLDSSSINRKFTLVSQLVRWIDRFTQEAGSFIEFTRSYKKFGLNINKDGDLEYREWAPSARELSIVGFI
jgi:hypothetical protein